MLVNISSPSNNSLSPPNLSLTNSDFRLSHCYISRPVSFIFSTYIISNILLLLPLCIFIIYHGVQEWKKKCFTSSTAAMSHSDIFTYHLVTMELAGVLGCVLIVCALPRDELKMFTMGVSMLTFTFLGETFFHVLTCVERYLAVLHPIFYLSLKNEKWVRVRNVITGFVWLICFVTNCLLQVEDVLAVVNFCVMMPSLLIIAFCSVSVLCVLIRPGPGEQGGHRERADQSKQKAFYITVGILGVLAGRFVWACLFVTGERLTCVMITVSLWFNLPRSLVLPLLFLHKAGKPVCLCKSY